MPASKFERSHYLNVDLELESLVDLEILLDQLADQTFLLHRHKRGRVRVASLELASQRPRNPDQAIRAFVKILQQLPSRARRQWDAARLRSFNIGIQSGFDSMPLELPIQPQTIGSIAALGASLAITVYHPAKR